MTQNYVILIYQLILEKDSKVTKVEKNVLFFLSYSKLVHNGKKIVIGSLSGSNFAMRRAKMNCSDIVLANCFSKSS